MFRRLPTGLPQDPVFPHDLKGLGYFVNEKDEIRSIENPRAYFKFFLTKNDRHNRMQREAMNDCIRNITTDRLEELGLEKLRLPLSAQTSDPNLPIFISSDLAKKKRVVVLFGESNQDLGVFAHRIIGGKGGISEGSAVNFVKYIQSQSTSANDDDSPGIILANLGQLRWWRRGKKAVTATSWDALPQSSAVEAPYVFDEVKNTIPGNRSVEEHVYYVFNEVIEKLVDPKAQLSVIGVSEGAVAAETFLDDSENLKKWGKRISALAVLATWFLSHDIENKDFSRWLIDHGRAYVISPEPASFFIADYNGRKRTPAYGCAVFSLGEPYYAESMLPKGYKIVLDWVSEVASTPGYKNPRFQRFDLGGSSDEDDGEDDEIPWNAQEKLNYMKDGERFVEL